MKNDLTSRSKYLSLLLRHKPEQANLHVDGEGWVMVSELIKNAKFTLSELKEIVASDSKGRYSFNNACCDKIRANQGHSFSCNPGLKETPPPQYLYHGTSEKNHSNILKSGAISKMGRKYVHLSSSAATAEEVGKRHGKPVVLTVSAGRMFIDGFNFYLSENNVWLVDSVPSEYFK